MIHPPKYKSFEDKEKIYLDNLCIETEEDLQSTLNRLVSSGRTFIYRGLCDASYKMYTSAQRYWIDNKGAELKNNTFASYADYLQKLIDRSKTLNAVQYYLQKHHVHYNEMWMLALMQHYQAPSIMLDFSHDLYSGLFFMCNGADDAKGDASLADYVSLYFMDDKVDWVDATVQSVISNCVYDIRKKIIPTYGTERSMYETVLEDFERLPLQKFLDDNTPFICLEGPAGGSVSVDIPELNFHTSYEIVNGRLQQQAGLFFANFSETEPFAELLLKANTPKELLFHDDGSVTDIVRPEHATKHIHCWNINKRLIPFIQQKYLEPRHLNKDSVYCRTSEEDNQLENEMKRTHFVNPIF